jgi:SAM-dependent methyltransferase
VNEKIELLSVDLLDIERRRVVELKKLAKNLKLEFGWHYLLDISWILRQVGQIPGKLFMDAGAGVGVIQWYLAGKGAAVISVDRESRADLPPRFRRRYRVEGLRPGDLSSGEESGSPKTGSMKSRAADWLDRFQLGLDQVNDKPAGDPAGKVIIYNHDLADLVDIDNDSIDTIVAVSSLEHNTPEGLKTVVAELMRVLKPGAALIATLGTAKNEDWFHEPSQGWCYSEKTLRDVFSLSNEVPSNYLDYDQLFEKLTKNKELKDGLASFYFRSGDNGMPWGEWKPVYQPVGIFKIKT